MLASAQEKDQIPIECFAKKGSNCINANTSKVMFCNELRSHHHPTCIGGNNFGNCYDRIAHPPASTALQSFGVPCPAIKVLLLAMQTMRFLLGKTLHIPSFRKTRSPWTVCTFFVIPEQGKCVKIFLFVPMHSTK
jgi:hypothetical protein